ncbi:hypothetical protein N9W17_02275 [Jannaschia sp.]|nr:hypothetical protein [Jannaschia sp.]
MILPSIPSTTPPSGTLTGAQLSVGRSRAAPSPPGGAAVGETTQTGARIPPVREARAINASSASRPGADGRTSLAQSALDGIAKQEEEAALRVVLQKEILARIPVPVEALPKLAGDLEEVRSLDDANPVVAAPPTPLPIPANDPTPPTDPAA